MHRVSRIMLLGGVLVLAPMLAACENFDLDKLDVFGLSEKEKLPGVRKPLFPEGVPGVTQGIPPEYIRGPQQPANPYLTEPVAPDAGNASRAAAAPAEAPAPPPQQPAASQQQQQQSNWPDPSQQ